MAYNLIYQSSFLDVKSVAWRVSIYGDGMFPDARGLDFEIARDGGLVIEYPEQDLEKSVCGSAATLTVLSDSDRRFTRLYTSQTGKVYMTVERADTYGVFVHVWRGTLDTEQYEEPYSYGKNYFVTLTFSDFAAAERRKWTDAGIKSLEEIILRCCELTCPGLDVCLDSAGEVSLRTPNSLADEGFRFDSVFVDCGLFYQSGTTDDEDELMSVREVLETVLAPLSIRIIQADGSVRVYDFEGMRTCEAVTRPVQWDGADARLGVGKVYRKAVVTYEPTAAPELGKAEIDEDKARRTCEKTVMYSTGNDNRNAFTKIYGDGFNLSLTPTSAALTSGGDRVSGLPTTLEIARPAAKCVFTPLYSTGAKGVGALMLAHNNGLGTAALPGSAYYTIPVYDAYSEYDSGRANPNNPVMTLTTDTVLHGDPTGEVSKNYNLKISLALLYDPRYNPFENAEVENEKAHFEAFTERATHGWLPVRLFLIDDVGNVIAHYRNTLVRDSGSYMKPGAWIDGPADTDNWKGPLEVTEGGTLRSEMWLAWYDFDDRKKKNGFGAWAVNRQSIGRVYQGKLPKIWTRRGDGEFIPLPPKSGRLRLEICGAGIVINESGYNFGDKGRDKPFDIRWIAFKDPEITLVRSSGLELDQDDTDDFEYTALLDADAADKVEVKIKLGTPTAGAVPVFLGTYRDESGAVMGDIAPNTFSRPVVGWPRYNDSLEVLLMGVLFSQYATPRTLLSGTTRYNGAWGVFTDAATPGVVFLPVSQRIDCRALTNEVTLSEIKPNDYEKMQTE